MRRCRYLAASAHTCPSEGRGVLPRRRLHTSRTIVSTDDCLPGSRSKSVCVTFPPLMAVDPELQMSLTTLSWFDISLEAASICPSTFCIATAARRLMSGARPGISSMDPWMRPERNVAASTHTNASASVDGPDTSWPSRRLQTAFTISSTDSCVFGVHTRQVLLCERLPINIFGPWISDVLDDPCTVGRQPVGRLQPSKSRAQCLRCSGAHVSFAVLVGELTLIRRSLDAAVKETGRVCPRQHFFLCLWLG